MTLPDSVSSAYDTVAEILESNDLLAVLATIFVIYLFFTIAVFDQGLNSILSTLRFVTFLGVSYALVAIALNLQWGYTGLFNIGVAGFMAVGVYTMGIVVRSPDPTIGPPGLGLPLVVGIIVGTIAAGLVGGIAALPALRLRADYLAIVTLGFSEIIRLTLQSSDTDTWLRETVGVGTGGGRGMGMPQNPVRELYYVGGSAGEGATSWGELVFGITDPFEISQQVVIAWTYVAVLIVAMVLVYLLVDRIVRSPFGRVLTAIRDDELVANSLGKNVDIFKIKVFMLGCALMGLAGILWHGSQGNVSPTPQYMPLLTFYVFIAVIIGGSGSNTGSVVGGFVFAGVLFEGPRRVGSVVRGSEIIEAVDTPPTFTEALISLGSVDPMPFLAYVTDNVAPLQFILLGVVLIVLMQRRPEGLLGHRIEPATATDIFVTRGGADDE